MPTVFKDYMNKTMWWTLQVYNQESLYGNVGRGLRTTEEKEGRLDMRGGLVNHLREERIEGEDGKQLRH